MSLPNGEQLPALLGRELLVADDGDPVEALAVAVEEVGRVLLAVDLLGQELPVLEGRAAPA